MNLNSFSPPKSVFGNSEFLDLISGRQELINHKDVIKRFFTGSLEDKNIIDMQRENSALSNNKIKKQILNDYKDDFNIKNGRKQGSQALNKNNNNYNNN
ncbi:hypothetical protein COBT_003044, partial [Conglomerata obtusa]